MKIYLRLLTGILFLQVNAAFAQQIKFVRVIGNGTGNSGAIRAMAQDQQGYMWFSNQNKGLLRYDGADIKTYLNDPRNPNSLASNYAECLFIDEENILWIGLFGSGLDRFDPITNTFRHFRHHKNDGSSLSNDTVTAIKEDHLGNLWIGTKGGLDLFNKKTGKFTHYASRPGDASSLSYNHVRIIYEDKGGVLWVGCGSPFNDSGETPQSGGLNRFDRTTGKFTRYLHDPNNPGSIANNKVRAIFEDSKGNFWVGTAGDGLHMLDRATGIFTHYYYDPANPGKLSRPQLYKAVPVDHITFITEDATGHIWIGSFLEGINRYNAVTKKMTHHGLIVQDNKVVSSKDTLSGYKNNQTWGAFFSKDGLLWIYTLDGSVYKVNTYVAKIPYFNINDRDGNTFYHESNGNILWVGTDRGLIRKDLDDQNQKIWLHNPANANSLISDTINALRVDEAGIFWMATSKGLCKFDPRRNKFTAYKHNEKKTGSLSSNYLNNLCIDHQKHIWIATEGTGLDMLDRKTGIFMNYRYNRKDRNSLSNNAVNCIAEAKNNEMWIGTNLGLNKLNTGNGKFHHYLDGSYISSVFVDAAGIVWAGATDRLYRFDRARDQFSPYADPNSRTQISEVLHIMEDDNKNIWVSTGNSIVKINDKRDALKIYGESYGIHASTFAFADNYKAGNGQLFFGDQTGYYAFFPDQLKDDRTPPRVIFTGFKLGDREIIANAGSIMAVPLWKAETIKLNFNQNIFSFDFIAIDYNNSGEKKYSFMLENYDNNWHNIGTDHKAYFFNVPPGTYVFRARGFNSSGAWGERAITIIITPPWWRTWWAFCIFGLLFIAAVFGADRFQRQRLLQAERERTRERELAQAKEIEKAYTELKATQALLIQAEKMASLGELTAGIAHEIQNPLNFVNNFSEVNTELIAEMKDEIDKGNMEEVKAIAGDIADNEQKINQHGKRADAIVKGMLQHSRSSSGVKEPTDINALADEYLRLAYHGLRAKDKSFIATMRTDYDKEIGNLNIIPQDIGRVILNLITNAFYAVTEKKQQHGDGYEPTVSVSTRKQGGKVLVSVSDNGNGIPQKVLDKIFQPFFTTKPTGQGTGLGLSISYDIIKSHGGELKVETLEGEGTTFVIYLQG